MIENLHPDLPVNVVKACPHEGCEYRLAIEWWHQRPPALFPSLLAMPVMQVEELLLLHLEEHLDPSVRHA